MSTPITDKLAKDCSIFDALNKLADLERAANAMEEALLAEDAWRNAESSEEEERLRISAVRLRESALAQYRRLKP